MNSGNNKDEKSFIDEISPQEGQDYQVALELEEDNLQLVVPLTLEAYLRYGQSLKNHWEEIDGARHSLDKYHTFVLINKPTGVPVCYIETPHEQNIDSETLFKFSMFGTDGEELEFAQHRKSYYSKVYAFLKESGFIEKNYLKKFKEITHQEFDYKQRRVARFFSKIMESDDAELFKKFLNMNRYDLGTLIQECVELNWQMELVFMDGLTHFFMDAFWRGKGVYIERSKFNPDEFTGCPEHIIETVRSSFVSEPRLHLIPTGSRKKPATHEEIIKAAEDLEALQNKRSGGLNSSSGDFIDYMGTKNIDKIKSKHKK